MEKKQTAVQQLEEYLTISLGKDRMRMLLNEFQKAKEMEKEQIINSFEIGYENGACVFDGDSIYHGGNYYNQTYRNCKN